MSYRKPNGVWVVPENQIREFSKPGGPDYDKLIADCMKSPEAVELKTPKRKYSKPVEIEFELSDEELRENEKNKRFWNKDIGLLLSTKR